MVWFISLMTYQPLMGYLILKYTHMQKYIYIYIYGEMIDFGESDKMIKISEKVDKSNICNGFSGNISFFICRRKVYIYIYIYI